MSEAAGYQLRPHLITAYLVERVGVDWECRRREVMDLLEAAGFSKSNPYYVVKQGKVRSTAGCGWVAFGGVEPIASRVPPLSQLSQRPQGVEAVLCPMH